MVRFILLLTAFVLFNADLPAEIVSSADKSSVRVADKIIYTVDYSSSPDLSVSLPDSKYYFSEEDKDVPFYEIISSYNDESSKHVIVELCFYKTGIYDLFLVDLRDKDKNLIGYKSPRIEITAVNKEGKFEEDEDFIRASGYPVRLILIIIASLIAAVILFFLVRYILRRRERNKLFKEKPFIIFQKRIKKLNVNDTAQEKFADTLSFAFREYITGEIGFNAVELTTSEIIEELTEREKIFKNDKYRDDLMKIMRMWDMIKFAEAEFSSELLAENYNKCRAFAEMIARERESA
ncbi:MAG: hypothetical protein KA015_02410 [Spirochaetes bacterium]|nr:hypothetical protein [Spirochaetota bacterium]